MGFVVVALSQKNFERRTLKPFGVRYVTKGFERKKHTRYCYIITK
jgi:hypothetical protein